MDKQTITIAPDNPYLIEWHKRMDDRDYGLASAFRAFVERDDEAPYIAWHRTKIGRGDPKAQAKSVRSMIQQLRDGTWADPTPILFRFGPRGELDVDDGNHRAHARLVLGQSVTGVVDLVHPGFQCAVDMPSLYHPHPHPLLSDKQVWRPDLTRYRLIARELAEQSVFEVGCAEGVGLHVLQSLGVKVVGGSETDRVRRLLALALTGLPIHPATVPESASCGDVCLALSVVHHLPRSDQDVAPWVQFFAQYDTLFIELPRDNQGCHPDWMANIPNREEFWLERFDAKYPNRRLICGDDPHGHRNTWTLWR